jgi:hypothetical protein
MKDRPNLKGLLTPRWLEEKLIPDVPLVEQHVRAFVGQFWDHLGMDKSDQCFDALIVFLVEFGRQKGREKYNLSNVEPVASGFMAGFDKGFLACLQKHLKMLDDGEKENAAMITENDAIIAENRRILQETRAEADSIIADAKLHMEVGKAEIRRACKMAGMSDTEIDAAFEQALSRGAV